MIVFLFELLLYLILFIASIRIVAANNPLQALFFYPKPIQERVYELGLTEETTVKKRKKVFFMGLMVIVVLFPIVCIGLINQMSDFKTSYLQALLFLEVINWFDGIFCRLALGRQKQILAYPSSGRLGVCQKSFIRF
jgi:FtsH-binding integral membrane protein